MQRGRPRKTPVVQEKAPRGRPRKVQPPVAVVPVVAVEKQRDPASKVLVTCIKHDVSLGDERSLAWQESAFVEREIAEFLEARGQVKIG